MEKQFIIGDAHKAYSSLNNLMGRETQKQLSLFTNTGLSVNELNQFYSRFDKTTYLERAGQVSSHVWNTITLTEEEIAGCLSRVNPHKAPGPDGLRGRAVAGCTYQLKGVLLDYFSFSLTHILSHFLGKEPQSSLCLKTANLYHLMTLDLFPLPAFYVNA